MAAALAASSCSSGTVGGATLTAELDPVFDQVFLQWTDVGPGVSWVLEARVVPGAFVAVGELPPGFSSWYVPLRDLPELLDLEFRVTAFADAFLPVYRSNVAAVRHGLLSPVELVVLPQESGVYLHWVNRSVASDSIALERRTIRPDGTTADSTSISLPAATDVLVDPTPATFADGARLEYAVAAAKGEERSAPSAARTDPAPLRSPAFLPTTGIPGGVRLAFENRSAYATEIVVERADWTGARDALATLPASATTYDDFPPTGLYTYFLTAAQPLWAATSPTVSRRGVVAPPIEWGLTARIATVPLGEAAARAPSGAFATAGRLGGFAYDHPFYVAPGDDLSDALQPVEGARAWLPGVALDADGHPHAVYADGPADWVDPVPIVHAWHDGAAWRSEEIAQRVLSPGDATQVIRLDVGQDGTLHASWQAGPNPALGLEVASRVSGVWKIENVSLALGAPYQVRWMSHFLAGDGAGEPHLVVIGWDDALIHLWRDTGAWHAEGVPAGPVAVWSDADPFALLAGNDWIATAYRNVGSTDLKLLERTAAGWGAPRTLGGGVSDFRAARSPDGARVLAAAKLASGTEGRAWIREGGVLTEKRWFVVPHATFDAGFDVAGRAWVLDGMQTNVAPPATAVEAVLFEEP